MKKKILALCLVTCLSTQACASRNDEFSVYDSRQGGNYEVEERGVSEFTATYVAPILLGVAAVAGVGLFVWGLGRFPVAH